MSMIGYLLPVSSHDLEAYMKNSSLLEDKLGELLNQEGLGLTEIDKAWDGVNFLLTGSIIGDSDHHLGKVLFSMQYIDESQDLGYGPACYVSVAQVKELSREISQITPEELRKKYDPKKMAELELYPGGWEENDMPDYLVENFKIVQNVYSSAANNDQAIITFLS